MGRGGVNGKVRVYWQQRDMKIGTQEVGRTKKWKMGKGFDRGGPGEDLHGRRYCSQLRRQILCWPLFQDGLSIGTRMSSCSCTDRALVEPGVCVQFRSPYLRNNLLAIEGELQRLQTRWADQADRYLGWQG